jgi:hypothetical protein
MNASRRSAAGRAHHRARPVAAIGAAVAAGTAGLMAVAVGTAAAADELAVRDPAVAAIVLPPGRTAAATTVFPPAHAVPLGAPGPDPGGTPSTTPSADATPGS